MKLSLSRKLAVGVLLSLAPVAATANGYRLPDADAAAIARGEAFAATADNPSAIYYNPAGISQLEGHNLRAGLFGLTFTSSYKSPAGVESDSQAKLNVVPQLFYTYTAETLPLSVGLGFYTPFGLSVEWPQTTGFRTLALKSDLTYLTVNPVVSWRILTNLSVAAGPTINYSELELQQGVTPIPWFDQARLKGDAYDFGFNAGLMWKPHPMLSFGAVYRAKTEMDYSGSTETSFAAPVPGMPQYFKMDAHAKVPFPQSIAGGVSFRPTPKWNLEFDVDWTDWNQVGTIQVRQLLPRALALNFQSSMYYELGVTYYFDNGWQLSGGYIFNENSTRNATYTPLVPDQDRHFVTAGVGYRGRHFSIDAAYQFGIGDTLTVAGNLPTPPYGQTANGAYDYLHHGFAVSVGWHF